MVCIFTSVHSAFDVRIFEKEAQSLVEGGFEVTLIAPHSEGCKMGGVNIVPLPYPKSRFERMTRTLWSVYRATLGSGACVYHFHDPELIPLGILLKMKGAHVVYDVHEDVPRDVLSKEWIPRPFRNLLAVISELGENLSAKVFDRIVAATPTIARRFPERKTYLVQNFPRLEAFDHLEGAPYAQREPICVYLGGLSLQRGAVEMVNAMGHFPNGARVQLILAGAFESRSLEVDLAALPGWERTRYLGWISRREISELLCKARVGLVVLHPTPCYMNSLPIKIFEYMAAGLPVIASDFPILRQIIEDANCGLLVNPNDTRAIAEAIKWIIENPKEAERMGHRGAQAVRSKYQWRQEEMKLLEMYESLIC
ncbi:MAG: glycosyltransferase family 4 protein [Candidatus Acidiferrales bacterium]